MAFVEKPACAFDETGGGGRFCESRLRSHVDTGSIDAVRDAMSFHEKWRYMCRFQPRWSMRPTNKMFLVLLRSWTSYYVWGRTGSGERSGSGKWCFSFQPAFQSTAFAKAVCDSLLSGHWLTTSAVRSQVRASPDKRVDVKVPELVRPAC